MEKTMLLAVAEVYAQIPFALLVAGHALTVCAQYRRAHQERFLLNLLICYLGCYGGGTLTALLLQAPSKAGIVFLGRNEVGVLFTMAWWLLNYCPGDLAYKLYSLLPVKTVARVCLSVLRAGLVVQRTNAAAALFPGVIAAPLVIGTLAGCGGKLFVDAFYAAGGRAKSPSELSRPGYPIRSAFIAALANYLLVHVAGWMSEPEGLGLITTLYVAHSLAMDLTGKAMDYTEPLARLFHTVTLIPQPGRASRRGNSATGKGKSVANNPATPTPSATKQTVKPSADDDAQYVPNNGALTPTRAVRGAAAKAPQAVADTPGMLTRRRRAAAAAASELDE